MDKEKTMYMLVTNDKYELPLVVDRTLEGLARFTEKLIEHYQHRYAEQEF